MEATKLRALETKLKLIQSSSNDQRLIGQSVLDNLKAALESEKKLFIILNFNQSWTKDKRKQMVAHIRDYKCKIEGVFILMQVKCPLFIKLCENMVDIAKGFKLSLRFNYIKDQFKIISEVIELLKSTMTANSIQYLIFESLSSEGLEICKAFVKTGLL